MSVTAADFKPDRQYCVEVNDRFTAGIAAQPVHRHMFDALVKAYSGTQSVEKMDDPFSATVYARTFVLASWEEYIWRRGWKFYDQVIEDEEEQETYSSISALGYVKSQGSSTVKYQRLMEKRTWLRNERDNLRSILWAFRYRDSMDLDGQEKEKEKLSQEGKLFMFLDHKLQRLEVVVGNHMEMYAQRAALMQADAANRQARSSAQLTKVATVIVPCTFVASIFSMGGDFAAGERLFGVYWAVSLPVTFALLAWVLWQDTPWLRRMTERVKKMITQRRVRTKDEEKGEKSA